MKPTYRQTFTLTDMDVDCFCKMKLSTLLTCAQEVAGRHSALLGADYSTLAEKGLFWAVSRHRVQITRLPRLGETITVETWPMPTTRVAYPRATVAYDEKGDVLFKSVAIWVLMDTESRAMVLPAKSGVGVPGIVRGIEGAMPASVSVKDANRRASRTVGYSELDRNGHMNNTYYLNWVQDLLPSEFHAQHRLRAFHICYLAEGREGQQMDLLWTLSPEAVLSVEGKTGGEDVHRVFAVTAEYD